MRYHAKLSTAFPKKNRSNKYEIYENKKGYYSAYIVIVGERVMSPGLSIVCVMVCGGLLSSSITISPRAADAVVSHPAAASTKTDEPALDRTAATIDRPDATPAVWRHYTWQPWTREAPPPRRYTQRYRPRTDPYRGGGWVYQGPRYRQPTYRQPSGEPRWAQPRNGQWRPRRNDSWNDRWRGYQPYDRRYGSRHVEVTPYDWRVR